MFIDQLDERVNKCNNAYHRAMKMKPIDANQSNYNDFNKESDKKRHKFKSGDYVRIPKKKFAKRYISNRSEENFVVQKVRNTVPC